MRINQIKNAHNFSGLYNNKILLKGLEHIADHGASFATGVSFLSAVALRPLAINLTPKAEKENKKILSIDSISSGVVKLLVALGISMPIESAVKKIKENPEQFLKNNIVKNMSKKEFDFLTQTIKLGSNLLSAIPKSIISIALIPIISNLFKKPQKEEKQIIQRQSFESYKKQMSFKGDITTKFVSSIMESKTAQDFVVKHSKNAQNIARNTSIMTDIILTTSGILATTTSKKIEKENKKPLIINKLLSSVISIFAGCTIDEVVQKIGVDFIDKFKQANINDKKLFKYLEGLNIARPTIIFAILYYGLIPFLTTCTTNKLIEDKK